MRVGLQEGVSNQQCQHWAKPWDTLRKLLEKGEKMKNITTASSFRGRSMRLGKEKEIEE